MVALRISSYPELQAAIAALGEQVERDVIRGMRKVARWGRSEVLRESRRTTPRPRAWGNYERGWAVQSRADGAEIVNRTKHAIFVERGRRPGKAPPHAPIVRWVIQKGLSRQYPRARKIAWAITKKIARKGVKARPILAKTMPRIDARLAQEIKRVIAKAAANPPRA